MRRWNAVSHVVLVLCMTWCASADAQNWDGIATRQRTVDALRVWFVLPTQLVLPDAELPEGPAAADAPTLRAARGEYECLQLVVRPQKKLEGASVTFSEFTTAGGATFSSANWRANKVAHVPGKVPPRSAMTIRTWTAELHAAAQTAEIPDPLLPDRTFDLDADELNLVWLTVRVPTDATPGTYGGNVVIRRGEHVLLELPLKLTVWNFILPAETHLVMAGNVWPGADQYRHGKTQWEHLKPYYDNLKAHRFNATALGVPLAAVWQKGKPEPKTGEYETAMRYILDELKFLRFRLPGTGGAFGGEWHGIRVFEEPAQPPNGIWLTGASFDREHTGSEQLKWDRVAGQAKGNRDFGGALLPGTKGASDPWVEYDFDVSREGEHSVWLQVEPIQKQEKKTLFLDGQKLGTLSGADAWKDPLGFARLPSKVMLRPGRHTLRVQVGDVAGSSDTIYAVHLTTEDKPDLEKLLRARAVLTNEFKAAFRYQLEQMAGFVRSRGWLEKGQMKLKDEPGVGEYGRVAAVYEFAGQVLPEVKRELSEEPYPILRDAADVWTPYASAARFNIDEHLQLKQPDDEMWLYHNFLHGLGYPSVGVRLIPWMLFRHDLDGYLFWAVNHWSGDPWTDTNQNGSIMRGTFLYPNPKDGTPIDSIRWELFREGLEDYETLRLLKATVARSKAAGRSDPLVDEAEEMLSTGISALVRTPTDFSWDPRQLEALRTRSGQLLGAINTKRER